MLLKILHKIQGVKYTKHCLVYEKVKKAGSKYFVLVVFLVMIMENYFQLWLANFNFNKKKNFILGNCGFEKDDCDGDFKIYMKDTKVTQNEEKWSGYYNRNEETKN